MLIYREFVTDRRVRTGPMLLPCFCGPCMQVTDCMRIEYCDACFYVYVPLIVRR